jgi:hypothetical protein
LTAVAKPKFIGLSSEAKIAVLYSQNAQFKLTVGFLSIKARVKGAKPIDINPSSR